MWSWPSRDGPFPPSKGIPFVFWEILVGETGVSSCDMSAKRWQTNVTWPILPIQSHAISSWSNCLLTFPPKERRYSSVLEFPHNMSSIQLAHFRNMIYVLNCNLFIQSLHPWPGQGHIYHLEMNITLTVGLVQTRPDLRGFFFAQTVRIYDLKLENLIHRFISSYFTH